LLALIGLMRLARRTRSRWEPVSLAAGTTITVIGYEVPAAALAFLIGIGILVVTLLRAIATKGRSAGQAADCWQWH
jgi:chromate transport protein ChrA